MNHRHSMPKRAAAAFVSATTLALTGLLANAQAQTASTPNQAADTPRPPVGEATQGLLALQRAGSAASVTPRPVAGDVAQLSYQRYLDSFDGTKHPIPTQFGTTVKASGSAASR